MTRVLCGLMLLALLVVSGARGDDTILQAGGAWWKANAPETDYFARNGAWGVGVDSANDRPYADLAIARIICAGKPYEVTQPCSPVGSDDVFYITNRIGYPGAPACRVGAASVNIGYAGLDGCKLGLPPYRLTVSAAADDPRMQILGLLGSAYGAYGFGVDAGGCLVFKRAAGTVPLLSFCGDSVQVRGPSGFAASDVAVTQESAGPQGAAGPRGEPGAQGAQGPPGPRGEPGPTADTSALAATVRALSARVAVLERKLKRCRPCR